MKAIAEIVKTPTQENDLNKRLLNRAYDLILSWPLPETTVSNESKAIEPAPNQTQNITQQEGKSPSV